VLTENKLIPLLLTKKQKIAIFEHKNLQTKLINSKIHNSQSTPTDNLCNSLDMLSHTDSSNRCLSRTSRSWVTNSSESQSSWRKHAFACFNYHSHTTKQKYTRPAIFYQPWLQLLKCKKYYIHIAKAVAVGSHKAKSLLDCTDATPQCGVLVTLSVCHTAAKWLNESRPCLGWRLVGPRHPVGPHLPTVRGRHEWVQISPTVNKVYSCFFPLIHQMAQ